MSSPADSAQASIKEGPGNEGEGDEEEEVHCLHAPPAVGYLHFVSGATYTQSINLISVDGLVSSLLSDSVVLTLPLIIVSSNSLLLSHASP